MDQYIGRLLDDRYEILEIIGTGGMAVVYKARCHRLNRLVAIKILKDEYSRDEEFRRRFHHEGEAVAMLSHPNIVSVYDVSTSITADYIVMELIDGITLKQYMEKKGVLNWKETLHFAMQIAKGLEHAHSRGIVHRDIKPHNVMVLKNGSVKVMDFGIARVMSKSNTLTKEALGSVHYISPEQAKGGRVDDRSDIYSLGVVMYEMMAGRPPYDGETPVSIALQHINGGAALPSVLNPNIPGGLEQIIMKAMAHNVSHRYPSAAAMLTDMDAFRKEPTMLFDYTGLPIDAAMRVKKPPLVLQNDPKPLEKKPPVPAKRKPEPTPRKSPQKAKQNRTTIVAILVCALVAVVAICIFVYLLLGGFFTPQEKMLTVPKLTGMLYSELLQYDGFTIMKEEFHSDEVKAGMITEQKPEPDKLVPKDPKGQLIVVKVSLGPKPTTITMENLVERTEAWAVDALNNLDLDLDIQIKPEFHNSIPNGSVTRTSPQSGTVLRRGQTVTIWISKGKAPQLSGMPDLFKKDKDTALMYLNALNLGLNIVLDETYNYDYPAGTVMGTEPAKNEKLKTGQTVKLYISLGVEKKIVPELIGMDVTDATKLLTDLGFKAPKTVYVDDSSPKGMVLGQSAEKNVAYELTTVITLQVSNGSVETPVFEKNVRIDLRGYTKDQEVRVIIRRDGVTIRSEIVPRGVTAIVLTGQTGTGISQYTVYVGDYPGWDVYVDFTEAGDANG